MGMNKLVYVEWEDATYSDETALPGDIGDEPYIITSIGWLATESKTKLIIETEIHGPRFKHHFSIPKKNIKKRCFVKCLTKK